MIHRTSFFVLAALAMAGCGGAQQGTPGDTKSPAGGSSGEQAQTSLIPRAVFFGDPDKTMARLSPDGTQLSYLAPLDGVLNIWVAPLDDLSKARSVTNDRTRPVRRYHWAYTSQHILYEQDTGGDENWQIFSVDLSSGKAVNLTPMPKVAARIEAVSHLHPDHVVVGLNDRDPKLHDLYKIDIRTGERTLLQQNPGVANFMVDDDFHVRLASNVTPDGGTVILEAAAKGPAKMKKAPAKAPAKDQGKDQWKPMVTIPAEDGLTTSFVEFTKDGKGAYFWDSRGRNTSALYRLDLATKDKALLAEDPRADGSSVILHPTEKTVLATSFTYTRQEWKAVDPAFQADLDALAKVDQGDLGLVSSTLDGNRWIAAFSGDNQPVRYHLWDREQQKARFLFSDREQLEKLELARMHPVVIQSRDGLSLVSYLTLPVGSDPDQDARPAKPLPMVLLVHGGPWGRDVWGYHPLHQLLANRGYAVLSVNFRGSTGLGKRFINAGNREWGLKMHDDLIDAVRWAVNNGIAAEDRVGIMGGSYGGYATLAGLTFTPEVFACGVDIVGPSNIVSLLEAIPPYWAPIVDMFKTRVGDWTKEEDRKFLLEHSPLTHADKIVKPLLIGQGANDPRVPQKESDQIVEALVARKVPVTYAIFPDEGHGFARPANRMAFYAVTEAFLSKHLGGAFQAMSTEDFQGSTIQLPVGADGIPGLPAGIGK